MEPVQDNEQSTHQEIVRAARRTLTHDLGVATSELADAFHDLPVNHRVRVAGVKAQLARFAVEQLAASDPGVRFGGFQEGADDVTVLVPTEVMLRAGLSLPVLTAHAVALRTLVRDLTQYGAARVLADLHARPAPEVAEITRRLREAPPAFTGWHSLAQADVERAFATEPPLISDHKDVYHRIRLACSHAVDRAEFDELARRNPGFVDYLQCFPVARSIRRKVVAWLGPTNSGKTHRAILALSEAPTGIYLGPLRLLALEQRDRLVELGRPCSLITGEERDETSPTHSARTVEMTNFSDVFAVAVLDEMQLAFDRDRGWAWVAAYCGVAAETLIVTGPSSAEPVIRRLAERCGDTVEVHHLERQGPLIYEGVLDWRHVPPRSAVIGFSRAMVLELKAMFEARGLRVAVIYGGLSPEVRRAEAKRFRTGEADIVCATDAIGLGLNLPIDRVVFYEVDKFDGESNRGLTTGELMQIAGRAGRGPGATGLVAALSARDGRRVANALTQPQRTPSDEPLPAAPTVMHVRAIATHLGVQRLTTILEFFQTRVTFPGGLFFPDVQDDVIAGAELVDTFAPSLPVEKRYALACAPIDVDEQLFRSTFAEWLEALEAGRKAKFPRRLETSGGLDALEETLKLVTVYRWLALKFPETFTDLVYVEELRRSSTEQTQVILRRNWSKHGLVRRECKHCGRALLPSSPHRICRACHSEGFSDR